MSQRIYRPAFGLLLGVCVRLLLPGYPSIGLMAAALLSLAGAVGGEIVAEWLLPDEADHRAGFAVTAIGALTVLLAYGMAS